MAGLLLYPSGTALVGVLRALCRTVRMRLMLSRHRTSWSRNRPSPAHQFLLFSPQNS